MPRFLKGQENLSYGGIYSLSSRNLPDFWGSVRMCNITRLAGKHLSMQAYKNTKIWPFCFLIGTISQKNVAGEEYNTQDPQYTIRALNLLGH
jgi:hypothetical protein